MNCLKTFNFNLTQVEKLSLMKKMDENGDNEISKEEFLAALLSKSSVTPIPIKGSGGGSPAARINRGGDEDDRRVDQALLKIK